MKSSIAMVMVFIGCCTNVIVLETIIQKDPSSGNVLTFFAFVFISLEGFVFTSRFGTRKANIPIRDYSALVLMFVVSTICGNYAFNFNISVPLNIVFRSGSLLANMIMGIFTLNKRYNTSQFVSVFVITAGVIMFTVAAGTHIKATHPVGEDHLEECIHYTTEFEAFLWWIIGISFLTVALILSARMGIYQEIMYARYGKHPREALFYTHCLPLPCFILLYKDISTHLITMGRSEKVLIPIVNLTMPNMFCYSIAYVVTQYVCIGFVYVLTTECSSLTVTLVVTLRRFVSVLVSIVYFKNTFTLTHCVGTILVFLGTITFVIAGDEMLFGHLQNMICILIRRKYGNHPVESDPL